MEEVVLLRAAGLGVVLPRLAGKEALRGAPREWVVLGGSCHGHRSGGRRPCRRCGGRG